MNILLKLGKRTIFSLFLFLAIGFSSLSVNISKALIEPNGNVIYSNSDELFPIYSLTKLMTTLVILDKIQESKIPLTAKVNLTKQSADRISKALNDTKKTDFTLKDLLVVLIDKLDDTAAIEAANYVFKKSDPVLLYIMNKKAIELKMDNTVYANSIGMAKNFKEINSSTASDIAKLAFALIKNNLYMSIYMERFNRPKYKIVKVTKTVGKGKNAKKVTSSVKVAQNTGEPVNKNSKIKTLAFANHPKYGYHLISFANINKFQLIAVILGARNLNERNSSAVNLLSYGYDNFERIAIGKAGEFITEVNVVNSVDRTANLVLEGDLEITLPKNSDSIDPIKEILITKKRYAPLTKGEKIGVLIIKNNGKIISKQNIIVESDIKKIGVFRRILRFLTLNWI